MQQQDLKGTSSSSLTLASIEERALAYRKRLARLFFLDSLYRASNMSNNIPFKPPPAPGKGGKGGSGKGGKGSGKGGKGGSGKGSSKGGNFDSNFDVDAYILRIVPAFERTDLCYAQLAFKKSRGGAAEPAPCDLVVLQAVSGEKEDGGGDSGGGAIDSSALCVLGIVDQWDPRRFHSSLSNQFPMSAEDSAVLNAFSSGVANNASTVWLCMNKREAASLQQQQQQQQKQLQSSSMQTVRARCVGTFQPERYNQ